MHPFNFEVLSPTVHMYEQLVPLPEKPRTFNLLDFEFRRDIWTSLYIAALLSVLFHHLQCMISVTHVKMLTLRVTLQRYESLT